jgi:hypothetical protein
MRLRRLPLRKQWEDIRSPSTALAHHRYRRLSQTNPGTVRCDSHHEPPKRTQHDQLTAGNRRRLPEVRCLPAKSGTPIVECWLT